MNSNDIFRKSDLGREEIRNQSLGVLPREARTLLIMIDGKKTYQNYIDSLDQSSMFAEFGGVAPLFELLLDFQCIEVADQARTNPLVQTTSAPNQSTPAQLDSNFRSNNQASAPLTNENPSLYQLPPFQTRIDNEAEFDSAFNKPKPEKSISIGGFFKRKTTDATFETLKSELATYIENNVPSQEAWGHLLNLEQCSDASQLLTLARNIQRSTDGSLSRDMDEFSKKIKRQL